MIIKNTEIESIIQVVNFKKNYVLALKKRLLLIKTNFSKKDEYEKNEIDITVFQTQAMISVAQDFINKKESELIQKSVYFYIALEDLERNYNKVIEEAKLQQSQLMDSMYRSILKSVLRDVNWKSVDEDIEVKLKLYNNIKEIQNEIRLGG